MSKYCEIAIICILIVSIISESNALNKYSFEANKPEVRQSDKPFRMSKLNQFWQKAIKTLDTEKLKNLMADLKVQDKDEISLKKLKAEGQDKDGIKEAQIRRQLSAILDKYGLNGYYKKTNALDNNSSQLADNRYSDSYLEKQIFRDKKLDKLWNKALNSGLNEEQLKILKEELRHHEQKIGQYNQLINEINKKEDLKRTKGEEWENSMNRILNEEDLEVIDNTDAQQALKDKHLELKQNYKRLNDKIINSLNGLKDQKNEFEEQNVQILWDLALKSNFNREELISLREELDHYQNRIRKLKHFESQLEMDLMAGKGLNENMDMDMDYGFGGEEKHLKRKVKDLNYKVNKLHNELENRIMQRHIEL